MQATDKENESIENFRPKQKKIDNQPKKNNHEPPHTDTQAT